MQSSSQAVCLNLQSYPEGKEEAGGSRLRGALQLQLQQVKDYVLWSLFNFAFANCCCLGFAALAFSIKSRDRKVAGDVEGANSYGKTALGLNITAMILILLFIAIFIALIATGVMALSDMSKRMGLKGFLSN
ncbi:dispanin subfamily A member 2b-like [Tiliqua scincoides]|uniref:dispanin subfamily A member 2b-like n=1 Tax=Tiliqua scincoides TaxID=71010 RepID=UPI003462D526